MARALSWLLGVSAFALPTAVRANDAPVAVRLELAGPIGCVSARELLGALQSRNGRVRLAAGEEAAVTLRVRVEETSRGLRGELEVLSLDGGKSSRSVEGKTCQAVIDALSLSAALALQQTSSATPVEAPVGPADAAREDHVRREPDEPERSTGGSKERPARFRFEAGAQASLGQMVTPHLNVGGGVLARARLERGSRPSLSLSLAHTRNELFESSRHAVLRLTSVGLTACPVALAPAAGVHVEPCLTGTGAKLDASGRDLAQTESVARSWWGVGGLVRFALSLLRDISVEIEGGALIPLVDRRFVALPSGTSLGSTPLFAPFASVGLVYAL